MRNGSAEIVRLVAQVMSQARRYPNEVGLAQVNTRVVVRLLGITHGRVLAGFVNPRGGTDAGTPFRYCSRCLAAGYHDVVHQTSRYRVCPVHGCPLEQRCRSCECSSAYCLDAQLLEAPYRCRHCQRYFASVVPLCSALRRRLDLGARVSITRSMRLESGGPETDLAAVGQRPIGLTRSDIFASHGKLVE